MQVNESSKEKIYVIMKNDCGYNIIEGCYVDLGRATRRLAVLRAERDLEVAKACEENPNEDSDCYESCGYWIESEELIR